MEATEKTYSEQHIAAICRATLLGLDYLHKYSFPPKYLNRILTYSNRRKHITHRDVKAANILLNDQGEIKLAGHLPPSPSPRPLYLNKHMQILASQPN